MTSTIHELVSTNVNEQRNVILTCWSVGIGTWKETHGGSYDMLRIISNSGGGLLVDGILSTVLPYYHGNSTEFSDWCPAVRTRIPVYGIDFKLSPQDAQNPPVITFEFAMLDKDTRRKLYLIQPKDMHYIHVD